MARRLLLFALVCALLACGGNSTEPNTTTVGESDGPQLTIEGRSFGAAPDLGPGESMTIVNLDSVRHTFTSGDDSWEAVEIVGDSQAQFTVPAELAAGSYTFFCEVHSDMGGTLTVG